MAAQRQGRQETVAYLDMQVHSGGLCNQLIARPALVGIELPRQSWCIHTHTSDVQLKCLKYWHGIFACSVYQLNVGRHLETFSVQQRKAQFPWRELSAGRSRRLLPAWDLPRLTFSRPPHWDEVPPAAKAASTECMDCMIQHNQVSQRCTGALGWLGFWDSRL